MTPASAADLNAQYVDRDIPLDFIDEPDNPERETMEEIELAELAMSIMENGLIKKLIVEPRGDRFTVVAGHRRLLACRLALYTPVPCRVVVNGKVDADAIKVHENAHTEPVNPIEEARFYLRLLEQKCNGDFDALCSMVRRKTDFVDGRLSLLNGHPRVVDALHHKKISIAVSHEINKAKDEGTLLILLDTATRQGATARQVEAWRRDIEANGGVQFDPANVVASPAAIAASANGYVQQCFFCEDSEDQHLMEQVWMHKPCRRMVLRVIGRGNGAGAAETN